MLTRLSYFANIGALITLVVLGLDPFFQQTLKYDTRAAIDNSLEAQTVTAYGYNGTIGLSTPYSYSCEHQIPQVV